ncbi:MAG: hypothetical protein HY721_26455, partial [Planctomycetes bacterium]|nr:hypothetical protein [Planctomycetota bacterium]
TGQLFTSSPSASARTYAREAEAQAQEPAARTPETPASSRLPASARCPARPPSQAVLHDAPPASGPAGSTPAAPPSAPRRTVRLLSENPRAQPRKPPSAFEEHQARRDPDKTLFITEETTTDLSHIASSEAFRGAAQGLDADPSPHGEAGDAGGGEIAYDETEIIEDPGAQVQTAVQAGLGRASAHPKAKPRKKGLTSRVLKAIFTP